MVQVVKRSNNFNLVNFGKEVLVQIRPLFNTGDAVGKLREKRKASGIYLDRASCGLS
jgi:hypothetical protein